MSLFTEKVLLKHGSLVPWFRAEMHCFSTGNNESFDLIADRFQSEHSI